jgi:hypothetical protein
MNIQIELKYETPDQKAYMFFSCQNIGWKVDIAPHIASSKLANQPDHPPPPTPNSSDNV